jgi:hypothetical protein
MATELDLELEEFFGSILGNSQQLLNFIEKK